MMICLLMGGLVEECWSQISSTEQLEHWHQWRGPFANGSAASAARPPIVWDRSQNIKWVTELAGTGTSTPIVWGNRVFILSAKETNRRSDRPPIQEQQSKTVPPDVYFQFVVTCVNRQTGDVLWQQLAIEDVPHEGHHPTHTYAGSSPTTDGKRLYVSFGSRGIFCYSLDGELLWKTDPGDMKTRYGWGESVTPVIQGEWLIINWDQEEGSFITCLDPATGGEKWKTARPKEVTSWNTPLVTEYNGRWMVVANGTDMVRAYDVETGTEIWSCAGQTVNAIPSPLRYADSAIVMSGYRGAFAAAVPLGSVGNVTDSKTLKWRHRQGTPYVPSPLLAGNRLMFTGGNGNILTVLNVDSGQPIGEPRRLSLIGNLYASPVAAGGHIYFLDRDGTCLVLKNNDELSVVAVNRLEDATDASPVAIDRQLFIRSRTKLYCIAE